MSKIRILFSILCVCAFSIPAIAQDGFAVKTNLLCGGVTLTPNLGVEFGLGRKTSLELFGSYNAWNVDGSGTHHKKLAHWLVQPAFRYWFCERFSGHFIGAHALYTEYNIGGHNIPLPFNPNLRKEFRYQGNAVGVGFSYGYDWVLSRRFNLEFESFTLIQY